MGKYKYGGIIMKYFMAILILFFTAIFVHAMSKVTGWDADIAYMEFMLMYLCFKKLTEEKDV